MVSKKYLAVAIVALGVGPLTADAQQNLPRPIVLYRPPTAAAQSSRGPSTITTAPVPTKTVTPNGPRSNGLVTSPAAGGPANSAKQENPAIQQTRQTNSSTQNGQSADQASNQKKTPAQELAELLSRPTNQMLQNPSGAYNLTQTGITSSQQMAPNNYFGQQFQAWSNQQPVAQMPASFGEMSRYQPAPFGGYVAPNTYVGSGFSSWSNLSPGGASPGATGSWNYSVWP